MDLTEEEIDQYLTSSAHEDHQQTTDDIEKGVSELVRKLTFDDHEAFTLTPKVPNHVAEASTNLALDISSKEVQQPPLRRRAFTAPTLRPPSSVPFMRVDDLEMVESRTNSRTEEEMDPYSTTAYHQDKQTTQTTDDIEKGVGELVRKSLEEEDEEWFWVWA